MTSTATRKINVKITRIFRLLSDFNIKDCFAILTEWEDLNGSFPLLCPPGVSEHGPV